MDCPRPIKSVLPRFYPTWSSRTRPSMRIQRSEGLGSRLQFWDLWECADLVHPSSRWRKLPSWSQDGECIYVDRLVHPIWLVHQIHNNDQMTKVAKIMKALKTSFSTQNHMLILSQDIHTSRILETVTALYTLANSNHTCFQQKRPLAMNLL